MTTQITVTAAEDGLRLDKLLVQRFEDLSRRGAARLVADGAVLLPGARPTKSMPVRTGMVIELNLTDELLARAQPVDASPRPHQHPDVSIVYQDEHLTVVHKPAGRPSHPLGPDETDTVANHLAWADPRCLEVGGPAREGGLCHRLDNLTSGLLVAARTAQAYAALRKHFTDHDVQKGYLALVGGEPPAEGQVRVPINSIRGRRKVQLGTGLAASSRFRVVERYERAALVEVSTHTGRRHQVRAHLAHAGHPLVNDKLYAGTSMEGWSEGPLLHAHRLEFDHPAHGEPLQLEAPLSTEQRRALDQL